MKTHHKSKKEQRKFGMLICFIFLISAFYPLKNGSPPVYSLIGISIIPLFLAVVMPEGLNPFFQLWMKFAYLLGWINTRIILTVVYFSLFCSTGLILKLIGKRPIDTRFNKDSSTYWCQWQGDIPKNSMKNQF